MADLAADYREARPAVSGRLTIRRPHRAGKPHDHHGRHGGTSGYGVTDGALADRLLDPATDDADDADRSAAVTA